MTQDPTVPSDSERFNWLERKNDDFPYYRGRPVEISTTGWIIVLAGVALGFAVLIHGPRVLDGAGRFLVAFLYWAIPLAALALVAGRHWTALFRPLRGIDFLLMIGFAVLNLLVTLVSGSLINALTDATANTAVSGAGALGGAETLRFFALTGIQLIGEEVMSILPFLALLYWFCGKGGMSRKPGIVLATLVVAVIFALEHGSTYDWNIVQMILGVGIARVVLLLPYIMTKNLAVSAGAHILNDWIFFGVGILGAAASAAS